MSPSSLRDGDAALPRVSFSFLWGAPLPSQTSASKFAFAHRAALNPPHAPISPVPRRAPAGRPLDGSRGLGFEGSFFLKQKALAVRQPPPPPSPRHLPFTPTPHLPDTRAARCLSRQTMGSGPASPPTPSPVPHSGTPSSGLARGDRRRTEEAKGGHTSEGAPPLGPGDSLPARGRRGEGGGQLHRPVWGPGARSRPPPRTHQHDGKSLLQFTWLGHRQLQRHVVRPETVCCESMLPALPMLVAHVGQGATPGPLRPRRKSEQLRRPAPCPLAQIQPGSPAPLRAPARCSARRSLAALGAEPPPGLPHAPCRPSAAPASFPRRGRLRRCVCALLRWHAAPASDSGQRERGCSDLVSRWDSGITADTQLSLPAITTVARPAPRADSRAARAPDTMPPSRPAPAPGPAPPTRSWTAGTSSFCPASARRNHALWRARLS